MFSIILKCDLKDYKKYFISKQIGKNYLFKEKYLLNKLLKKYYKQKQIEQTEHFCLQNRKYQFRDFENKPIIKMNKPRKSQKILENLKNFRKSKKILKILENPKKS